MKTAVSKEKAIRSIVQIAVQAYGSGFEARHVAEKEDPNGTINMKVHNPFIAALGPELQFYSALVRSLDSSLGDMLEKMAISLAELSYDVSQSVEGYVSAKQTTKIARLLEEYKRRIKRPEVSDYGLLVDPSKTSVKKIRHDSDYYLIDRDSGKHYLIELKIGGDLDNKKARSEKEALLEQYCILSNNLGSSKNVSIKFATAYNRFGDGRVWAQERVRQFFAPEELLIGRDFWNFITKIPNGYEVVLDEYAKHAPVILQAVESVKKVYIG